MSDIIFDTKVLETAQTKGACADLHEHKKRIRNQAPT